MLSRWEEVGPMYMQAMDALYQVCSVHSAYNVTSKLPSMATRHLGLHDHNVYAYTDTALPELSRMNGK